MAAQSNCAILDKACCLFAQANLLPCHWAEAVITATDLCNLLPSSTRKYSIPYTTFFSRPFNLSKLRSFGCLAYVLVPKDKGKSNLAPLSERGIFLGYSNDFTNSWVLLIDNKTTCLSCNVTFDESVFPLLKNESIDDSSFFFNPFKTLVDEESNHPTNFDSFPNQETYIGPHHSDKLVDQDVPCPSNKIVGDVSPENILSHRQWGVPPVLFAVFFECFAVSVNDDTISYNQVMNSSQKREWFDALKKETNNMGDYEVWDVIKRSNEEKPLNCTWVFKIKPRTSNQVEEYKARLCVQGFKEVFGKDFSTTFAPTGKLVSLRLLITFALQRNLKFHQIDVKCAFLNAPIQERITPNPPPGINAPSDLVLLLKKALYGLKQAPKEWHLTLSLWLLSIGFNLSYAEPCVFWSLNTWLYVHVNNIAIFSEEPKIFINMISKRFKIKELGVAKHLLGMQVLQFESSVTLTQTQYIEETLLKYKCQDLFPLATPMNPGSHLVKASKKEAEQYSALGVHY
jgi:hypothetical protein